MATAVCPHCLRPVVAAGPEAPRFCSYCGQKLEASSALDGETQAFLPDPRGSADELKLSTVDVPVGLVGSAPHPTARIAGYSLIRFLGAGGMGTVYEAEAEGSGRRVAVKVLSSRLAASPASVERFRQEGRVASQISHPRCVFVLSADTAEGRPFIVMELMPGRTLKDLVDEQGPLPVLEALDRTLDVIDGLAEAHRLGVIHRDVKPSNCFLTADDRVKVGDFGLSKSLSVTDDTADLDGSAGRNLTTSGAFLGTVMYASPEQIRGEPVGYDSDVYAVCATLYFLLTGQAPFQHESLTASLAKAVSEPPPPIRPRRADCPRELERVIRRGLDRDRGRRFPTLEALRDALVELKPSMQRPAGLGAVLLAYLCDWTLVQFLVMPIELVLGLFSTRPGVWMDVLNSSPFLVTYVIYFVLFEGLTGAAVGKRLLRLRVVRLGEVGPPGLRVAALRTLMFGAFWLLATAAIPGLPWTLRLIVGLVGLACLCVQFLRTTEGWRGLHDRLTGTAIVERARPPHRPLLKSPLPNPLDEVKPSAAAPPVIGGFVVVGKLSTLPDRSEVWLADDRGLSRRVLLHILPADVPVPRPAVVEPIRPTRLRVIGRGHVAWPMPGGRSKVRHYTATVAPAGAPLLDLSSPERPLTWAETRPVLEQLVDELTAATREGPVAAATVAQVWVEPNGRPQLLDFPLPHSRELAHLPPPAAPLDLVRQVATLCLEGNARTTGDRIQAPIPLHASQITDNLFNFKRGYDNLDRLWVELAADATQPAVVTASMRRTHLGLFLPLAFLGLFLMAFSGGFLNFVLAVTSDRDSRQFTELRDVLADPERRADLIARARSRLPANAPPTVIEQFTTPEKLPQTLDNLTAVAARRRQTESVFRSRLNRPERAIFDGNFQDEADTIFGANYPPPLAERRLRLMNAPHADETSGPEFGWLVFSILVLVSPAVWIVLAFVFRGGFAMSVAGIAHVRADGCRAGRFRVAVRELLVWLPVTLGLLAAVWVQAMYPDWIAIRTGIWLASMALLVSYLPIALLYPARPPQDRILGTVLVPR